MQVKSQSILLDGQALQNYTCVALTDRMILGMDERANGRTGAEGDVLFGKAGRSSTGGFFDAGASDRDCEESSDQALGQQEEGYFCYVETQDYRFVTTG